MSKLNGQNVLCVVLELLLSSELVDFMSQSESLVLEFSNCLIEALSYEEIEDS